MALTRGVIVRWCFLQDLLRRHHQTMAKSAGYPRTERQMAPIMRDYKEIASRIADEFGANATYVEDLLRQFQHNPNSVDEEWSDYFQSLLGDDGSVKVESRITNGAATATVVTEQPAPAVTTPAVS